MADNNILIVNKVISYLKNVSFNLLELIFCEQKLKIQIIISNFNIKNLKNSTRQI